MASYLGGASPIRNTQHLVGASQERRDAPKNQAFFFDGFDIHGHHAHKPVPADIVALVKTEVPNLRDPTALQLFARELKKRFKGDFKEGGQIYFGRDFTPYGDHATLPKEGELYGGHVSVKPATAETHLQAFAREHGAEGGRMAHGQDYVKYGEHATQPVAGGKTTGEFSKRAIAGVGNQAKPMGGGGYKHGGIVKGKKGQEVPIVAHAGELVVPVKAVDKVLKSSAWIDHVKSVQKAQGISYKDAMKMAKGSYKK